MEKKCTKCGETKLLEEYHNKKTGKYGRASRCKVCVKAYRESEAGKEKKKPGDENRIWMGREIGWVITS